MISLWVSLIVASFSFANNELELKPSFQNSPFIAQSDSEVELDPGQRFDLMKKRANELCVYFKAPSGRFRSRVAAKMNTKRVKTNGQKVAILKRSGQTYSPSLGSVGANLRTEIFISILCKGNP
jgi:hypothetical protein